MYIMCEYIYIYFGGPLFDVIRRAVFCVLRDRALSTTVSFSVSMLYDKSVHVFWSLYVRQFIFIICVRFLNLIF